MGDDPDTEELQAIQHRRERTERADADAATDKEEAAQHERRADKAAYLQEKLDERARSERQAESE